MGVLTRQGPVYFQPPPTETYRSGWDRIFGNNGKIEYLVQINGIIFDKVYVDKEENEDDIQAIALSAPKVKPLLDGISPMKIVVVPKKFVNIVIETKTDNRLTQSKLMSDKAENQPEDSGVKISVTAPDPDAPKPKGKGRGRPKGSKNKPKTKTLEVTAPAVSTTLPSDDYRKNVAADENAGEKGLDGSYNPYNS